MTMLAHNTEGAIRSDSLGCDRSGSSTEKRLEEENSPRATQRGEVQVEDCCHVSVLEEVAERWANEEGVAHLSAERASAIAGLLGLWAW